MRIDKWFEQTYQEAIANKWLRYFTVFCRVMLALGFIPSGIVKVTGERFTALPSNHPLGHYFDALHLTGYYYTFLGVSQLLIALLLLIPGTALLGALLYFPVILNICVLDYATRFEGTRIATFMLLANVYLLCWNYDRIKYLFPFNSPAKIIQPIPNRTVSNKFPLLFFAGVIATLASVVIINKYMYKIRPGNSFIECKNGCPGNVDPAACEIFCDCIYNQGKPLDSCLAKYEQQKNIIRDKKKILLWKSNGNINR